MPTHKVSTRKRSENIYSTRHIRFFAQYESGSKTKESSNDKVKYNFFYAVFIVGGKSYNPKLT